MLNVCLFIKDFELGTRIAERLTVQRAKIEFVDSLDSPAIKTADLTIVDCDLGEQGTVWFMSQLRHKNQNQMLMGYMKIIQKEIHDKLTAAGCELIIPQSSLVKNIQSIMKMIRKHED